MIKGKATKEHIERVDKYCAPNYAPLPVVLCKARGIYVWDVEGKKYIDMLSAYSANNQGHAHPKIARAMKKQIRKGLVLTSRAFHNNVMGEFLEKLCKLTGYEKALPMNTGAEAVETAIKAMRKYAYEKKGIPQDKAEIIVAENNFHGRTTTIVGFSSDKTTYSGFGPFTPGFKIISFGDKDALERAINENTVGFLVEPIQGEAGVNIPYKGYLKDITELCSKHNILLCFDEVQTGLGRTGKLFAYQHEDVRPDLLILGKALSGGFYPVSAVLGASELMDLFKAGTHGSTFGGNPLGSSVAIAALDVLIKEKLSERAAQRGEYFLKKLQKSLDNSKIKEIRGRGLLIAVEMNRPIAKKVCEKLAVQGILAKDTHETTVRFAPSLIITKKQIDKALVKIKDVINDV